MELWGKAWWGAEVAPKLREWWKSHGSTLLRIALVLVAIGTPLRLIRVFKDLIWNSAPGSAGDLISRHLEVHTWFAGQPVYRAIETSDYPPASYAILWPFLGWMPLTLARWLWAATILVGLGTLAYIFTRVNEETAPLKWLFVASLPFSVYPTAAVIGLGQLTIHSLAALAAGLLILHRGRGSWFEHVTAAALLIISLAKPTVTAPFFWLVFLLPGRLRVMALILIGYLAITILSAYAQPASFTALIRDWLRHRSNISLEMGYINISGWLAGAGFGKAIVPMALITLLCAGVWVWRYRAVDFWLQLGVLGLATRFWIHHRAQDDLLILFPMIALLRLARQADSPDGPEGPEGPEGNDVTAGLLFALIWITMMAPTDLASRFPKLASLRLICLGVTWTLTLVFLLDQARKERARSPSLLLFEELKPSEVSV